ncbi:hypothetical protein CSUI_010903, partial [Cystoisospora suis]
MERCEADFADHRRRVREHASHMRMSEGEFTCWLFGTAATEYAGLSLTSSPSCSETHSHQKRRGELSSSSTSSSSRKMLEGSDGGGGLDTGSVGDERRRREMKRKRGGLRDHPPRHSSIVGEKEGEG